MKWKLHTEYDYLNACWLAQARFDDNTGITVKGSSRYDAIVNLIFELKEKKLL